MRVYRFTENDYETVCSWWKKQDWPVVPYENLSVDGMIVKDDKNSIAAGWLFKTNSPVYILEWIVGNPEVEWEKRDKAIFMIVEYASKVSSICGAKTLFTMTKNKRLLEKLKNNKFIETDNDMTHLLRYV